MADDDVIIESSSSPSISNPGTPAQGNSKPGTPAPYVAGAAASVKAEPSSANYAGGKVNQQPPIPQTIDGRTASPAAQFNKLSTTGPVIYGGLQQGGGLLGLNQSVSKYTQLLAVIEDMGRDIRPTYAGNKASMERLKRGIVHARILVRECLMECERSARS